jgi:hypothetical protein
MVFSFRLEDEHGAPAEPPTLKSAVPDWRPGDTIPLGPEGNAARDRSPARWPSGRRPCVSGRTCLDRRGRYVTRA